MKFKIKGSYLIVLFVLFFSCELEDFGVDSDDPRDDIVDVWSCEEESDAGTTNYTSEISIHPSDSSKIIINYIYGLGRDAEAIATYKNRTITIPQQDIEDIIIKGTGNVSSDYSEIRFNYTADDGSGDIDNVFALYTR
jgi:hypothetical protein